MNIKITNYRLKAVLETEEEDKRYFLLSGIFPPVKTKLKKIILKNLKKTFNKNMIKWEILDRTPEKNENIIIVIKKQKRFSLFLGKINKEVSNEEIMLSLQKSIKELDAFLNKLGINIDGLKKSYEKVLSYNQNPNLIPLVEKINAKKHWMASC